MPTSSPSPDSSERNLPSEPLKAPIPLTLTSLLGPNKYTIYTALGSYLNLKDLLSLNAVSRDLQHILPAILAIRYNINRHLRKFFQNPKLFRSILGKVRGAVSGSDALQYFMGESYPNSDLDVYLLWNEDGLKEMANFLQGEGYKFDPYEWQRSQSEEAIGKPAKNDYMFDKKGLKATRESARANREGDQRPVYDNSTIISAFRFIKKLPTGDSSLKIELICLEETYTPIREIIEGYHSTHILNFYTYDKAYCLYPQLTLNGKGLILRDTEEMIHPLREKYINAFQKYRERGWRLITATEAKDNYHYLMGKERTAGDEGTWIIEFNTEGVDEPPPLPPRERWTMTKDELRQELLDEGMQPSSSDLESMFRNMEIADARADEFDKLPLRFSLSLKEQPRLNVTSNVFRTTEPISLPDRFHVSKEFLELFKLAVPDLKTGRSEELSK